MDNFARLVQALKHFHSVAWINQYFDLLKRLLTELELENDDPRLALSLNANKTMPVNLGQRYILQPLGNERIGCIVPTEFQEEIVGGHFVYQFSAKTTRDAKWIHLPFQSNTAFPSVLYDNCLDCCFNIMQKAKRTGYRKFHCDLLYDFTMERSVRNEVLAELENELN